MSTDPTTAAIECWTDERAKLRAEVDRLERALVAAYTDVQIVTAERDVLRSVTETADRAFEKGFGQAVHEIRDHFKKQKDADVADEIAKIWLKDRS